MMLAIVAGLACSRPEGLWRDQYMFVGDDGALVVLGLQRQANGLAEAKGWLAERGAFRSTFYDRFSLDGAAPADTTAVLAAWSNHAGARARATLGKHGLSLAIGLRTPDQEVTLEAAQLAPLGTATDPEGESSYLAGRAALWRDAERADGWLLVEETPSAHPRRPFIDYGDFVFVALARANGDLLVAKRSHGRPGFDHAFARIAGQLRRSEQISADASASTLRVRVPDLGLDLASNILARDRSSGTAPDGRAVSYDTLALGGEYRGVAFLISPTRQEVFP